MLKRVLVVREPFGPHKRGSMITDDAEITAIESGQNAHHVTPTTAEVPEAAEVVSPA
jgi:hypothetical protein